MTSFDRTLRPQMTPPHGFPLAAPLSVCQRRGVFSPAVTARRTLIPSHTIHICLALPTPPAPASLRSQSAPVPSPRLLSHCASVLSRAHHSLLPCLTRSPIRALRRARIPIASPTSFARALFRFYARLLLLLRRRPGDWHPRPPHLAYIKARGPAQSAGLGEHFVQFPLGLALLRAFCTVLPLA